MGKHEIRLRRQRMTTRGVERFKNYSGILERHEKEMRLKKILKVFGMFFIILFLIALFIFVSRIEKRVIEKKTVLSEKVSPNLT